MSNILLDKYPLLFEQRNDEPYITYGIECLPGWNNILDNAFKLMYKDYKWALITLKDAQSRDSSSTDYKLRIEKQQAQVADELSKLPIIMQVKEKFGTLRIYADNTNEYHKGVIAMAEAMSELTCEECGSSGELDRRRWHIRTLCKHHLDEKYSTYNI